MNFVDKDGTTKVYIPVHPCVEDAVDDLNIVDASDNEDDIDIEI